MSLECLGIKKVRAQVRSLVQVDKQRVCVGDLAGVSIISTKTNKLLTLATCNLQSSILYANILNAKENDLLLYALSYDSKLRILHQ